ncbi:MAG: hypothetical protein IJO71_12680 [Microbacterium sp.]|uniref:hypothetical protein n=1 Tax=Microbacterium sp. TaxID=51671 RepID=UPI0025D9C3DC|nr:hypothetical protein [Microbacterium sp.]MBQ9918039.1 hypothetical protein [Microbacterium sp.]
MSAATPGVQTVRWLIKVVRVSSGRMRGHRAWVVQRYIRHVSRGPARGRLVLAVLGYYGTLPAAMDAARKDCGLLYDERSRP